MLARFTFVSYTNRHIKTEIQNRAHPECFFFYYFNESIWCEGIYHCMLFKHLKQAHVFAQFSIHELIHTSNKYSRATVSSLVN